MRLSIIQLERKEKKSREESVEHALNLVDGAKGSDLVMLPEMWDSGFFCFDNYHEDAQPITGPMVEAFRKKAADIKTHILMGSFVEKDGGDFYNTSVMIDSNGLIMAKYRKIHLFGYESKERDLLTRGKDVVVVETPWGKAGLATCYDLRFPEQFRKMVDLGAVFFLIVSAWPSVRSEAWILFNRVRALENLAFLISCNCAGSDSGMDYAGQSMIVDPLGKVLAQGGDKECLISAEIETSHVISVRKEFSALHDRIDLDDK